MEDLQAAVGIMAVPFVVCALTCAGIGLTVQLLLDGLFDDPTTKAKERSRFHKFIVTLASLVAGVGLGYLMEHSVMGAIAGGAAGTVSGVVLGIVKKRLRGLK